MSVVANHSREGCPVPHDMGVGIQPSQPVILSGAKNLVVGRGKSLVKLRLV